MKIEELKKMLQVAVTKLDRSAELERALELALEFFGNHCCPIDVAQADLKTVKGFCSFTESMAGCKNYNPVDCWKKYYLAKAKEALEKEKPRLHGRCNRARL